MLYQQETQGGFTILLCLDYYCLVFFTFYSKPLFFFLNECYILCYIYKNIYKGLKCMSFILYYHYFELLCSNNLSPVLNAVFCLY